MSAAETFFCRSSLWGRLARHAVLPWAMQGVRPRGGLLELGAGNGAMAEGLARRFPDVRVTATDVDPVMLTVAERRLAYLPNATVAAADVTGLPFSDKSFEFVASFLMLHHVVEWRPAIAEAARVLRPRGTFVGYDLGATRLAGALHRADRSPHQLIAIEDLASAFEDAALDVVALRPGFARHVVRFKVRRRS